MTIIKDILCHVEFSDVLALEKFPGFVAAWQYEKDVGCHPCEWGYLSSNGIRLRFYADVNKAIKTVYSFSERLNS